MMVVALLCLPVPSVHQQFCACSEAVSCLVRSHGNYLVSGNACPHSEIMFLSEPHSHKGHVRVFLFSGAPSANGVIYFPQLEEVSP
jgi:hypothetical protein